MYCLFTPHRQPYPLPRPGTLEAKKEGALEKKMEEMPEWMAKAVAGGQATMSLLNEVRRRAPRFPPPLRALSWHVVTEDPNSLHTIPIIITTNTTTTTITTSTTTTSHRPWHGLTQ